MSADPVHEAARAVVKYAENVRKVFADDLIAGAIVLRPETFAALRAALDAASPKPVEITDAMVERAAVEWSGLSLGVVWDALHESERVYWRETARAVLQAALEPEEGEE